MRTAARTALRAPTGLTTRGWFRIILGSMVLVITIGAIVGAHVIGTTAAATNRLIDSSLPAQRAALELQTALRDQETGIRGFALTGDRQFLQPYDAGVTTARQSAEKLRELLGDKSTQLTGDLDEIERTASAWRTAAVDPLLSAPNLAQAQGDRTADAGKQLFDQLRTQFTTQNRHLTDEVTADTDHLYHARTVRDSVLIGFLVIFLATGAILMAVVRRLVERPLRDLADSSLRVAGGEFTHHIEARGPADVRAVAAAVEAMRRRIVAELEASREQGALLHEQKLALDAGAVELRRSNAELEQFAYVASHDLQEPLRKIASFCQLLEKRYSGQLDERATQYIAYAVDGAKRMQTLINDLLTFSRVGRSGDGGEPVDLALPLDRALANLAAAIEDSDARVIRPPELPRLTGEPVLLTMLWQNLIGNAIKFRAPDRAPEIVIDCEPEGAGWLFSVRDNGIGIEPEFAEKVFVIFQRLHGRGEYTGTGIGLALTKKIVEQHGGRIWIDTEYTGGTRVLFTLAGLPATPADYDISTEGVQP
ncbi:sensor histidine kinase [Nocardia inohanensis]|uniref:sensor histidine kinase n=1 Tax=Nocardia inohanensis TaxID=209246 RepID=UPI000833192B|nr:sensor histidine kinase [Nocardia inohanensis]